MPEMSTQRNKSERNGTSAPLTPREDNVAAAVAAGVPLNDVCDKFRLGRTTLWNWMQLPHFQSRVHELRKQALDTALGRLSELLALAAKTYKDMLTDPTTPARLKKDIADSVFEKAVGLMNFAELRTEIEKIKAQQSQSGASKCGI